MHGVNANDGLNFVRYKYKHMANRNSIHESIAILSTQIAELNADLTSRNDLSVLDIDLLRKHTIDLYEGVNQLRLAMKDKVEAETKVKEEAAITQNPEPETPIEVEVKAEAEEEAALTQNPEPETPVVEAEAKVEEEAALTQNPEPETPIEVEEEPALTPDPEPVTPSETPSEEKVLAAEAKVEADAIKSAGSEEEANDLASKFSNTPINDMKKAISIAKKFEFINALFAGNVEKYAYSIHHMNNLKSGDEAFNYLHDLRAEYKWDDEDKNFLELANLVRRRYLG